jgi:hypothetical protein
MEDFVASDSPPLDVCRQKVAECDLFLGILGLFYGSCPPDSRLSFTELEYQAASGRPRLIFVTPEDFSVKGDDIEDDDRRERQQRFRRQVGQERIRSTFSSPAELANEVILAIYNWERKQALLPSPSMRAEPSSEGEGAPDRGPLVHKMCDRSDQEHEFKGHFLKSIRQKSSAPQVYILSGEELECPESLVERLTHTYLKAYADQEQKKAFVSKRVKWPPAGGELDKRYELLLGNLFEAFHPFYGSKAGEELSSVAFAGLEPISANSVVVLEHEIELTPGDPSIHQLLKMYLGFWDEIAAQRHQDRDQAVIVAFLWMLYPRDPAGRQERVDRSFWSGWWLRRRDFDQEAFQNALIELQQEREAQACLAPCLPLTGLTCVKPDHVMRWFSNHKIHDMNTREEKCSELFAGRSCLRMAEIEKGLKKILDSFHGRG